MLRLRAIDCFTSFYLPFHQPYALALPLPLYDTYCQLLFCSVLFLGCVCLHCLRSGRGSQGIESRLDRYSTVLEFTALFVFDSSSLHSNCDVLYCTVLYCHHLNCVVLHCIVMRCSVLFLLESNIIFEFEVLFLLMIYPKCLMY